MKAKSTAPIIAAFLLSAMVLSSTACTSKTSLATIARESEMANSKVNLSRLPTSVRHSSSVIDREDRGQFVALADYVVVGRVDSYDGVTYTDVQEIETADGMRVMGDPYSHYTITALENLKGDLVLGEPIPIQKSGGVDMSGRTILADEGDVFPQVGKIYVFLMFAQPDGETLLVSGMNSSVAIEGDVASRLAAISGDSPSSRYTSVLADSVVRNNYVREAERDAKGEVVLPEGAKRTKEKTGPVSNKYDESNNQ